MVEDLSQDPSVEPGDIPACRAKAFQNAVLDPALLMSEPRFDRRIGPPRAPCRHSISSLPCSRNLSPQEIAPIPPRVDQYLYAAGLRSR
jgi:hypothetical protein